MKKLALITKTISITRFHAGETGINSISKKEITTRFLGIAVYKSTIVVN